MYLRSITLKGFKSFPDRTKLEFGPGVSVVVGPNGSGKSNITDAVLWALGEQSPVAVRGQSMQDVIFGGAPGRQAAVSAEVELVLDDCDGTLGIGVPEVSVVRRLDRSGEGEYRLAGARCRLVDVIELLSDTGLGKEMHSVISQGRVESLVTSKPRDRRMLIEEAAGLGKHRKRRRRAQLKLARTQDNLDRALDVEREARSRLRPLKRQAEAAELHARLERQSLEARWELTRDDLRGHLAGLEEAQLAATAAREERERVERELEEVARRRQAAEEALARRSAERELLSRRCFVAQSAAERVGYRTEAVRAASTQVQARLRRNGELLAQLELDAAREVVGPEAGERIAALEASLASLERERESELAHQLADLEQKLAAVSAAVAERAAAVNRTEQDRELAEERQEQARTRQREAERSVQQARHEAARTGGELAVVNQFLRSQVGPPGGATVLADELEVDPGYELAVAAALDGRLRAAVAVDRGAAAALLEGAGIEGGRTLVISGGVSNGAPDMTPPAPGAERLDGHIRGRPEALVLAKVLLRDTWVVETLEEVAAEFAGVAVTRRGRVWSPRTRELRQAPAVGEERVLAERNRREELIRANEAAARQEVEAVGALERATAEVSRLEEEREVRIAAHRGAIRRRDEASEDESRVAAQIERRRAAPDEGPNAAQRLQLEAKLEVERGKLERVEHERAEREATRSRLVRAIDRDERLAPGTQAVIGGLEALAAAISAQGARFEAALSADREAGQHVAEELRACAQKEATLHAGLHGCNETLTQTEVRLQRARDEAAEAERDLREIADRLELEATPASEELDAEQRDALGTRIARLARRREQLGPVNPLAQQEYADAVEHVEELERQRSDLESALRELEKLIADTDRQIRETFEQTFEAAARSFEQVVERLFPGGRGHLRLVSEREGPARVLGGEFQEVADDDPTDRELAPEEDLLGVEIEITPAGKEMKRLSLLSGGEKSMTALAFLFAVFLARPCPFYILDEVEAALDDLNIDRFLELLRSYSQQAQFIVVTHQRRTMEAADSLYGVSMGGDGISKVISRRLPPAEAAA